MTKNLDSATIDATLIEDRLDLVQSLLAPLLSGKAVMLFVTDLRLPRKTRKYKTTLFLAPFASFGLTADRLLVAMPPYGSEILDPDTDLKDSFFVRLGLSFSLSRALVDALRNLYGGQHGT